MSYEVNRLLDKLPEYRGRKKLLKRRQHTTDIIHGIMTLHPRMMDHYDRIAADHWQGNVEDTARELYDFAKRNLPYKEEKTMTQTVKTPAAILEERYDFGNDCKHYASYIVGVGEALRRQGKPVKCFYRFASYKPGEYSPGHVFAVFVHNGKEIWVDPVPQIRSFDSRAIRPVFTIDKMPPMSRNGSRIGSLYEISGVPNTQGLGRAIPGDQSLGNMHWLDMHGQHKPHMKHQGQQSRIYRWRGEQPGADKPHMVSMSGGSWLDAGQVGKAKKHHKKHHGLHLKIKAPHIKVQPGKFLKKFAGATSRNAFGLLVKLNTFHLATNMWKNAARDLNSPAWKRLAGKWRELGGSEKKLYTWIKQGVNTYNKLHKAKKHVSGFDYPELMNGPDFDSRIDYIEGIEESVGYIPTEGEYHDGMTVGDIMFYVGRNHNMHMRRMGHIGVVQVAGAAIIAAAGPILAALAGVLKALGVNTKKTQDAADAATDDIAKSHNEGTTDESGDTTHQDGTVTAVKNNPDGSQTIQIKHVPGTSDKDQDSTVEGKGEGDDEGGHTTKKTKVTTKTKTVTTSGDEEDGTGGGFLDTVKNFIVGHKLGTLATGVGAVTLTIGLAIPKKRKGNGAKYALIAAGVGSIGFGVYNFIKK